MEKDIEINVDDKIIILKFNQLYEKANYVFEKIFTQKPIDIHLIHILVENYLRTLNEEQLESLNRKINK